ncbi:MAG TPA: TATA-box-binding protein [Euryarchaeota archaeon]|nr:TATA-box-binding protein [Euryarchaeota archaeon]
MGMPEKDGFRYNVENIVASASLDVDIDLFSLALTVDNVEYEPEQFPGAILKIDEPKSSLLVFKNGKLICTGNKDEQQIREAIRRTVEILREAQPNLKLPDPEKVPFRIENIVASASLDVTVDLYSLAATLDNVEYEPEQFPGAIIRLENPKATILLFKNGKLICAGVREEKQIVEAIKAVKELIKDFVHDR